MKKTKTERINELFTLWKIKQHNESDDSLKKTKVPNKNITKDHFCSDGIINEDVFEKEDKKVLFIANEANANDASAKEHVETSRIHSFTDYYNNKTDSWKGKLRERVCVFYKVIINDYITPEYKVSQSFAFINLNKRGGLNNVGEHIKYYVDLYKNEIIEEIHIIDPDIIVWLGKKTFYLSHYLNVYSENNLTYMNINDKKIPVLSLPHTSCAHWLKNEPMDKFPNRINGKLATRIKTELEKFKL